MSKGKRETFVLVQKKTFRHTVKLYLKSSDEKSKIDVRNVRFTTEHKVNEKERARNARKIAGEFSTSDEVLIDALFRDTGYGKTFTHKDDPEGKLKRDPFNITPLDARKIALKNLFAAAELEFDSSKSVEVLTEEYNIHVAAVTGVAIHQSTAAHISHVPVDVFAQLNESVVAARKVYEDKYGEPVPAEFADDKGFLSALADPKWDAKAYIEERKTIDISNKEESSDDLPETAEELGKIYFNLFGKNVANLKKNDAAWIKKQITEHKA